MCVCVCEYACVCVCGVCVCVCVCVCMCTVWVCVCVCMVHLQQVWSVRSARVSLTVSQTSARCETSRCSTPPPWRCSPRSSIAVAMPPPRWALHPPAATCGGCGATSPGRTATADTAVTHIEAGEQQTQPSLTLKQDNSRYSCHSH